MTTLQLIRPPLDDWYGKGQLEELVSVPANLCLLANCLRETSVDVQVLDGMNIPLESTTEKIDSDWVGVTDLYSTHLGALKILEEAKKKGATTVIGGPNVDNLSERILTNHKFIDYIAVGDGEEALPLLLSGENLKNIPNLVYRKKSRIVKNKRRAIIPNTIFDLEDLTDHRMLNPNNIFPISAIRGCIKAQLQERCSFCSIDRPLKLMRPRLFWQQIDLLNQKYGITYFWETGDSFMVGNYPKKLLEARPSHLSDVNLKIYANPQQIWGENVKLLEALNVKELVLGIETSNSIIFHRAKGYSFVANYQALKELYRSKIDIHLTFIYGLPGETFETAEESFELAELLVSNNRVSKIVASFPIPLPGTVLFENLRTNQSVKEKYRGDLDKDDSFDYQALVRLQLEHFTDVNYEFLANLIRKTKSLIPSKGQASSFYVNES